MDNTVSVYSNILSETGLLSGHGLVSVDWTVNNSLRLDDRWSGEIGGEYESKRRFVGSEYGGYYLVNLAVRRSLWKGRGSVTLNAHNIFQSEAIWSRDSYPGLQQHTGGSFYTRYVSLGVAYRWGRGRLTRNGARSGSEEERGRAGN